MNLTARSVYHVVSWFMNGYFTGIFQAAHDIDDLLLDLLDFGELDGAFVFHFLIQHGGGARRHVAHDFLFELGAGAFERHAGALQPLGLAGACWRE